MNFSTVPEIPVYRPTFVEFEDFSECISKIEELGAHHVGLCKVIPPEGWNPRVKGYGDLDDLIVHKPIYQTTYGSRGIYIQV